jgi:hypothetical protein
LEFNELFDSQVLFLHAQTQEITEALDTERHCRELILSFFGSCLSLMVSNCQHGAINRNVSEGDFSHLFDVNNLFRRGFGWHPS